MPVFKYIHETVSSTHLVVLIILLLYCKQNICCGISKNIAPTANFQRAKRKIITKFILHL